MKISKLLIIGAGGHGLVAYEIAKKMKNFDAIVFIDDNKTGSFHGIPIVGTRSDLKRLMTDYDSAFIAVGDNVIRMSIFEEVSKLGYKIPSLVDSTAILSDSATIGLGVIVMPGVILNAQVVIGDGTILNTGSIIEHECHLSSGVHISPGVCIGGSVSVGKGSWIGIGAVVSNGLTIGEKSVVGAGAVLISDVGDSELFAGVPARYKKSL